MRKLILILSVFLLSVWNLSAQNIRGNSLWSHTTITADSSYVPTGNENIGDAYYDADNDTWSIVTEHNIYQVGQELAPLFKNVSGATMYNGQVAYYAGAVGSSDHIEFTSAALDGTFLPSRIVGILTEDIPDNGWGKVTWFGGIRNFDINNVKQSTDGVWAVDDILYASNTEASKMTNVMPNAPYYTAEMCVILSINGSNVTVFTRPTWNWKLTDLADVNGTPLTQTGQFPVWDNASGVFDFNYRVSNDVFSSDWDGKDTVVPTFDNIYDKISLFESLNYCNDSIELNFGTISRGSQDSLCAVDGNLLGIAEVAPNPPFQVDFVFQGVERLQYFSFYGRYQGGVTHNVHVLAYNYVNATWDFIGEFGQSDIFRWYTWPIFMPNDHINNGEVKIRVDHQGTGITSHRMYFDYVEVNFGGTGGGNFIEASAVDFMPYLNITSTNVQGAIQQFYDLWDLTDHPAATMTGTPDYITINPSTQVITRNQIDLTTDVTGLLPDGNISSATTWNNHVASTSNPHNITVDQLGIGADTITYTSHGLSAGDWFGYKNNSIIKCLADTSVNANLKGVVKEVIDVNNFTYLKTGDLYTDGVFVAGENYVLSTTTPGTIALLDTITYTLGDVYVFVGEGTDKGLDINIDVGFVIDTLETPEITVYKYEKQLTTSENVVNIGYTVNSSTLVFLNGYITSDWTGSGTSVTLNGDILANDYMIAIASGTTSLYSDVLAEDETVVVLPFTMESTSLPFYNGTVLQSSQYSGSITFSLDVKENDNTIIKQ